MKKIIILVLGACSLMACATFSWQGQNFDGYVLQNGVPTSQYTRQDNKTVYSFKRNCPDSLEQEEKVVVVNTDNIIENVSWVHDCPTVEEAEPIVVSSPLPVAPQRPAYSSISTPVVQPAEASLPSQPSIQQLSSGERSRLEQQLQTITQEIQTKRKQANEKSGPISKWKLEQQMAKDYTKRAQLQQKISKAEIEVALLENDIKRLQEKAQAIKAKLR